MIHAKLKELILVRGIKQKAIAKALSITARSLQNKISGKSNFTWPEVCKLQETFFPDMENDYLMKPDKTTER